MGSSTSKPVPCQLDWKGRESTLAIKESQALRLERNPEVKDEWRDSTIVSTSPLSIDGDANALQISVDAGTVLRFGLTNVDPSTDGTFLENAVFEKEVGFGHEPETRKLYIEERFKLLYFGKRDNLREYECDTTSDALWLYVITIYGSTNVTVTQGSGTSPVQMARLRNSGTGPVLETCKTKEPLIRNTVYYIKWSMSLEHETVAGQVPENGLLRLSLVSPDNSTVWERTSAVFDRCFNGTIAVMFTESGHVKHNLVVRPNQSIQSEQAESSRSTSVYLRTDFSCGQIEIDRMFSKAPVEQQNGPVMFLEFNNSPQNELYLKQDIKAKAGVEPVRIDFGCNPMKCVAEFRTVLLQTGIPGLKSSLCASVQKLQQTKVVQVFVPNKLGHDDIEQYFTRENVGGGNCTIEKLPDEGDDVSCWLITFKKDSIARDIWLPGLHVINEHVAHVLPFYKELGRAEKSEDGVYGRIPSDKNEKIKMTINDDDKFRFVSKESQRRSKLIQFVQSTVNVTIIWCDEESAFEEDSSASNVNNCLEIECEIPQGDASKRDNWQSTARQAVNDYFDTRVKKISLAIEPEKWGNITSFIENERRNTNIDISKYEDCCSIVIVGETDDMNIERISEKISGREIKGDIQIPLEVNIDKLMCLKEEGVLAEILSCFPTISIITTDAVVKIKGPINEVLEAQTRIYQCATHIKTLSVKVTGAFTKLFLSEQGREFLKQCLARIKIYSNFSIPNHSDVLVISTYCNDEQRDQDKETLIEQTISANFSSETIQVNETEFKTLNPGSWSTLTSSIENEFPVHISCQPQHISVVGSNKHLQEVKNKIKSFLKSDAEGTQTFFIAAPFAEYLDLFEESNQYISTSVIAKFSRGESNEHTGRVELTGVLSSVVKAKELIANEIKHIGINWFHISRKWTASTVDSLQIQHIQQLNNCLVQVDTADSFAANNIAVITLNKKTGAVIQVKVTDVTHEAVDVIGCPNDPHMKFRGVVSNNIEEIGGPNIKKECQGQVKQNGPVERSHIIESGPGRLHCITIVHAVTPEWIDGTCNEADLMKKTVKAVLKVAHDRFLVSVALPPFWCDSEKYTPQLGAQHVLDAVSEFMDDNPNSSVKEVILCVRKTDESNAYITCMNNLKRHWYTFQHTRPLYQESRPKSSRPRASSGNELSAHMVADNSLYWKHKRKNIPTKTVRGQISKPNLKVMSQLDEDGEEKENDDSDEQLAIYDDGLPYAIDISEQTTLQIMMGDITLQKTDVIVNVSQTYPALTGKLSRDIVENGGIKEEWDDLKSLMIKEVKSTSPGQGVLRCKRVYHVIGPSKSLTPISNIDAIRNIVKACLDKAEKDGYKSISFPTINQGQVGDDRVAETMVQSIHQYVTGSTCRLTNVAIVIFYNDAYVANVFEQEVPSLLQFESSSKDQEIHTTVTVPRRRTAVYVEPKTIEHTAEDDVAVFRVVAKSSAENIKKEIINLCEKEILTIEFDLKAGREKNISLKEAICLKTLEKKHIVDVNIDKVACKVQVTGPRKRVNKCEIDVLRMVDKDFPLWRYKDQLAEHVMKHVQWYYEELGNKRQHDQSSNLQLQQGFAKGNDFTYCNQHKGEKYSVDVQMQRECPVANPGQYRQIYQRFLASTQIDLPEHWTVQQTGEPGQAKVQLNHTDQEFGDVKAKLLKDGLQPQAIVNIYRLEHRAMWRIYQAKKQHIESQNPRGVQNERSLWHGTDSDTVDLIVNGGYNRSFCGKNATAYGNGAYFATTSRYSHGFANLDANGMRRMFLNKVLTGEYETGKAGMSCLSVKTTTNGVPVLYDSAVNNVNNPTMFIIVHDSQVYPEYLIEYN